MTEYNSRNDAIRLGMSKPTDLWGYIVRLSHCFPDISFIFKQICSTHFAYSNLPCLSLCLYQCMCVCVAFCVNVCSHVAKIREKKKPEASSTRSTDLKICARRSKYMEVHSRRAAPESPSTWIYRLEDPRQNAQEVEGTH